jgi:mutator protein MutT
MIMPVVAACIHSDKNYDEVLLTKRRSDYKETNGKWEFCGGRVEEGEGLEEALKREIFEELKLDIQAGNLVHAQINKYAYSNDRFLVLYYNCLSYKPINEESLPEHIWVNAQDIAAYDCLPGTIEAVRRIFWREDR